MSRMLVAGVGNIFRSDDGFGSAVLAWLAEARPAPDDPVTVPVTVPVTDPVTDLVLKDFGIRGVHLVYELLDGYDTVVLVDAMHRDGPPGTLYVVQPDVASAAPGDGPMLDAHDMAPEAVLALVPTLGGRLGQVTVVGCEPESVADGIGLSEVVATRVPEAGRLVLDLIAGTAGTTPAGGSPEPTGGGQ